MRTVKEEKKTAEERESGNSEGSGEESKILRTKRKSRGENIEEEPKDHMKVKKKVGDKKKRR